MIFSSIETSPLLLNISKKKSLSPALDLLFISGNVCLCILRSCAFPQMQNGGARRRWRCMALPGETGSAAAWPAGGLGEAGDSVAGWCPGGQARIAREAGGHGPDSGRAPQVLFVCGRPLRLCPRVLSRTARSCCGRQRPPPSAERPRVVVWLRLPLAPAQAGSSAVTNQPAPTQPRKLYCPCRLGSFLFLMKMNQTHR